ncbi:MAG TPA: glycosyltransferase family 9 protein [Caldimonas sp.]
MPSDRFRRILVICTRQLGDVLLTTPLIDAAKRRWPEAQVDVLGFAGTLDLLRGNPQVGELIEVPAGSGWLRSLALIRRLWRHYDLALIAQYSDRAHLYGAVAARRRAGLVLKDRSTSWWKRLLLDHTVEVDEDQTHAVLEKLRLIAPWTAPQDEIRVQPPPAHELPVEIGKRLRARYVVVQVPTIVHYKQWPLVHQSALVQGLLADGIQVVLSGGPSEADRAKTAQVAQAAVGADSGQLLDLAGALDLNQMVTLLRGAALYIGPDTSITHLAAACDTPVLAIYGPIDPRLWGPWPQAHAPVQPYEERARRQQRATIVLLQGDPPCVPCNRQGCERHNDSRSECLETLMPQRVLDEARATLSAHALP